MIVGGAATVGFTVWDRVSSAGGLGAVVTILWVVSGALLLAGLGYYVLLFAQARGWLPSGVPDKSDRYDAANRAEDSAEIDRLHIDSQHPAPALPDEFTDAPHLMWSGLQVMPLGHGSFEVSVGCNNVGKTAQVIRAETWVRSTVDVLGPPSAGTMPVLGRVTPQPEEIAFFSFDAGGHISPGPFTLRMQCRENDPIPGEREVRWRVTYMDDDMRRGYITECSVRVAFALRSPSVVGEPAYDTTSRKVRNDDYNEYMRDKGAPSTGPRRPISVPAQSCPYPIGGDPRVASTGETRYSGKVTDDFDRTQPVANVCVYPEEMPERGAQTDGGGWWGIVLPSRRKWTFHFDPKVISPIYQPTEVTGLDNEPIINVFLKRKP